MKKALIVIDMQNDYFAEGKMPLKKIDEALSQTNRLIDYARKKEYTIYIIQHMASSDGSFFVPNTSGAKIHADLDVKNSISITKHYPNSFRETELEESLRERGIDDLLVCGAMSHMCVDTTVRAGYDLGFTITLAQDACATKDLEFRGRIVAADEVHNAFMSSLDGTFCEVKDVGEIVL